MPLDRTDRAIISALSQDSRLSVRAIAERVHISRTAANTRMRRLIESGVLTSFTAKVDRKALGLNVTAIVIVTVGGIPWPEIARSLAELPFVENVLAVSGDIDFVITVSAPDNDRLSDVIMHQINTMPGVLSTRSHVVLDSRDGTAPGVAQDHWPFA
ncbi:Lrp/AsnC family transcriptional regulator [Lysinimonas soli]|uniref:Lrp/AsnC family transcriptional regulator n=1 Tax=Lysinimonas soli TaxID=1074233 RepID=A0ABW0NKH4_9MICO